MMKYLIFSLLCIGLVFLFLFFNKNEDYSYLLSVDDNKKLSLYKYNNNYKLKKVVVSNNITLENIVYDNENILIIGHDNLLGKDLIYKVNNNDKLEIFYEPKFEYYSLNNFIVYDDYYYLLIDFNLYKIKKDFSEEILLIEDIANSDYYIDKDLIFYRDEVLGVKNLYSYNLSNGDITNLDIDGVIRGANNNLILIEMEDGYYIFNRNDKKLYNIYKKSLYSSVYLDDIKYSNGFLIVNSDYPWDDIRYFSLNDNKIINELLYKVEDKMIINQFRMIDNEKIYIEEIDICSYEVLDPKVECEKKVNRYLYDINNKEKIILEL